MKFEGIVVKEPIVKEKIIITAIKLPNRENPIQVVVFPAYRDVETVDNIKAFKIDDKVIVYGNEEVNPKSKELQIIVNKAFPANNAKQEEAVIYDAPATRDISPTYEEAISKPSADLIPVKERLIEISKYTFPDGNFFYSDGLEMWIEKTGPRKKLTRSLIEHYNSKATMMHWFLPDWYTAGVEL